MTTLAETKEPELAHCPKCGRFLFRVGKRGEAIRGLNGVVYTVQEATCCGVTARYNAGRIEYERLGQRVDTASVQSAG